MIIRTYTELEEYFEMFGKQNLDLLIVLSRGGLGKTTTLKRVMKNKNFVYINTHSTPLKTYLTLYEQQDNCVAFDDVGSILTNPIMVSMLKSLSDTNPIKEINYNTTSKLIGNAPENFKTASNVCLLLNEFDVRSKTLLPIIDRGFYVEFIPSNEEIMQKIRQISKSQSIIENPKQVLDFFENNYSKIEKLSLRTFIKALQLSSFNKNTWKERFMQLIGFSEKMINYYQVKEKYKTDKERISHFRWSRATYFRIKQECEE